MMNKNFLKITTYAAIFGIVGGMSFEGVTRISDKLINDTAIESPAANLEKDNQNSSENTTKSTTESTAENQTNTIKTSSERSNGVSDIVDDVLPSIVAIDVTATLTNTDFFGRTYQQDSEGSGSGIIVARDEDYIYIATNNHVVSDTNNSSVKESVKVSIRFYDDSVCSAEVKGTDSAADLAVVAVKLSDISNETMGKIQVATLGDSDNVKVGEQAIAIGNALGYGTSVTVGYISAKDREVQGEDVNMKLIQTDAAINPGNSGGALVSADGTVIGINSAKYAETSVEGMGFAIPVNTAKPIIDSIIKAEAVPEDQAAYLGIRGKDVISEYAEYLNIPEGIYIEEVTEDAPASKAGIKSGDIIVKFNGMDVKNMDSLQEKLALCRAGDKADIVIKRTSDGQYVEKTMTVTLGKKSDAETGDNSDNSNGGNNSNSENGNGGIQKNFLQ
ncbi:MAG TPA: trypsin [Lachnospiraceae bacterium]|nr:trypsin [Lachnospiraceae bacterium]